MDLALVQRSLRDEHRDATRRSLIVAATERFAERGFASTSIDDVAAQARVTKGAVYYHFKNKREVFEAVYEDQARRLSDRIRQRAAQAEDPTSRVRAAADAFFESTEDPTVRRLMFLEGPSVLGGVECRRIDNEHFLGILTALTAELQSAGLFPEVDPGLFATLALALLIEASQQLGVSEDRPGLRHDLEVIAVRLIRGLASP